MNGTFTRREVLAGGGFLALASAVPGIAGPHWGGDWLPGGASTGWRHTIRLQGSTQRLEKECIQHNHQDHEIDKLQEQCPVELDHRFTSFVLAPR